METISNMTIGQMFTWISHNWATVLVYLLAADNILITACAAAGWNRAETFFQSLGKFLGALIAATAKKVVNPTQKTGQTIWEFLLLISACILVCGCMLRYHETTFVQGVNVTSAQYGHFDNVTVNHEGNFYIGVPNASN